MTDDRPKYKLPGCGPTIAAVCNILRQRGDVGASLDSLVRLSGKTRGHVSTALTFALADAVIETLPDPKGRQWNRRRYFIAGAKPAALLPEPESTKPATPEPKRRIVNGAPVVECPRFVDTRYTFIPPPGWKGQITEDWLNRRLQGAQR